MQIKELLHNVDVIEVTENLEDREINSITLNSREVKNNSLFAAIKGFKTDGHKYISDAVNKGASAVILEESSTEIDELLKQKNCVKIKTANSRKSFAQVACRFFDNPSQKLNLIGITGTKGKTTTAFCTKYLLEVNNKKSGLIGTIKNLTGEIELPSKLTTPEADEVNYLLSEMVKTGCSAAVSEVSSHSLYLDRVYGIDFDTAVFTNITSDHLDFHETFENYFETKKILFDSMKESGYVIYNIDDANGDRITAETKAKKLSYGFSLKADFRIENLNYDINGTRFDLIFKGKNYSVSTKLIGKFTAYNVTAALASAFVSGVDIEKAVLDSENIPQIPGRFQVINHNNKNVIIDYSHTADSLKQALESIIHLNKNNQPIYTVFGCGGDRDKTKRPIMGSIASELSDKVIVTSDNPRTENPFDIIEDIIKGISKNNYKVIESREEAIKEAVLNSEKNAIILIAGKGHEEYQEINGIRNHFSDKETAERYLEL
jgi:UDP-N-acetylmuramoyl-L-alanyl-D-glutamate--2,6-diaminopimelate ligase